MGNGEWGVLISPPPRTTTSASRENGERERERERKLGNLDFSIVFLPFFFTTFIVLSCAGCHICVLLSLLCVCVCPQTLLFIYFTMGWGKMGLGNNWEGKGMGQKGWERKGGGGIGKATARGLLGNYIILLYLMLLFMVFCPAPLFLDVLGADRMGGRKEARLGGIEREMRLGWCGFAGDFFG